MDIAILGSDEGDDPDMGGITGGVCGVAGGAEGTTSGIGSTKASAIMSTSISTDYGSSGSSRCGMSRYSGLTRAPWSVP